MQNGDAGQIGVDRQKEEVKEEWQRGDEKKGDQQTVRRTRGQIVEGRHCEQNVSVSCCLTN